MVTPAQRLCVAGPPIFKRLGLLVPYTAVVAAGTANLALTRWPEVQAGAPIMTPDGEPLGASALAAKESIKQTILSRIVFLPVAPILFPPLAMGALRRAMPLFRTSKPAAMLAETALIAGSLFFALPYAIAVFPQEMKIATTALEPEFQNRTDSAGRPIEHVVCNKGL